MGKSESKQKLSDHDINFLTKTTGFTKTEILDWHQGFLKDCPCGKLDKKKFIHVYKQFYPQGKADKFCEHVFRTFDTDSSGKIDFNEFLIAISITSHGDLRSKLNWAFTMYDIDRDGRIDKLELEKIVTAIYDLVGEDERGGENSPKERVNKIFEIIDTNRDSYLTKEEFVQGCMADEQLRKLLAPSS
ncbi:hypothetical protein SNEBB_011444 [Seison nebaliae]|nr:hypothetical protein SNEBB_011444 [Seison nebaliae]